MRMAASYIQKMTQTLIYVHDPLCGWCFGFTEAISHVAKSFPDLSIEIRLGGLVTGDRIAPYATLHDYVKANSSKMQSVTGARIGDAFLNERLPSQTLMSSHPPNCAILTVRETESARALDFTIAVQDAHFVDGADLNLPELYSRIACDLNLPTVSFEIPPPHDVPASLLSEYKATHALNFSGYPSLFVRSTTGEQPPVSLSYDGPTLIKTLYQMGVVPA